MSFNTIKTTYGCASGPPSSSSDNRVASSKPWAEYNVPNLGAARSQVWQHYERHRATISHQAYSSIQNNIRHERLSMPSLPGRGRTSKRHLQESSPFTQKARSSSPRKVLGKHSASIAEMGERLTPSKRTRQEGPEDARSIAVAPSIPASSSSDVNDAAVTGDAATTVQAPSDAGGHTCTCWLFDGSHVEWSFWLEEDPDVPAESNSDQRCTDDRASHGDAGGIEAFLDTWWKGIQKSKESPKSSGDKNPTFRCDPLKKEDREHAVPAATWYPWSAFYNEATRHGQGEENEDHEGPALPGAVEVGEAPYGEDVVAQGEDTEVEFPAPALATLGLSNKSTTTSQSASTATLALPLAHPEVHPNASQSMDPRSTAPFTGSHAMTVGPSVARLEFPSSRTTGEPSTAGATPNSAFRYTAAAKAKIWGLALQARYPDAYRLFDPSERAAVLEGEDVTRFVGENPNKVTKAARDKTKLWVCQATAKWSEDGMISYTAEPCKVANTSDNILMRHISTVHLGKVLPKYETKKGGDKEPGK